MKTREIDTQKIDCIKLPASLRNGKVLIIESEDMLTVKKIQQPDFDELDLKLKKAGQGLTEKDIQKEVENYRQGK